MKGQTNYRLLEAQLQRGLRNGATDAERALWQHLKGRQLGGCKFRRQHPYGNYILDFACLDGSQHMDDGGYDAQRTAFLEDAGFVVLRFWNNDVFTNIDGVLETIQRQLIARANPSPPNPPLEGEG